VEGNLQWTVKYLRRFNPNALTIIGIIPQALFFYFMLNQQFMAAAFMIILSCIDMFDGMIARATNRVTRFGAFLDSTVDRLSDFILIAGFYFAGLISLNLFLTLFVFSYLVSYVRSRAELASNGTIKFDVGLVERSERVIYLFIVLLLEIIWPNATVFGGDLTPKLILILILLSGYTLLQRIIAAYQKLD